MSSSAVHTVRPRLVALASQKGGSGKTTLALNLMEALSAAGFRCVLLDLSSRTEARLWGACVEPDQAPRHFDPLQDIVVPGSVEQDGASSAVAALALARATGKDIILADCPVVINEPVESLLRSADLLLVPTAATPLDHDATARTLSHLVSLRSGAEDLALVPVLETGLVPPSHLQRLPGRLAPTVHRDAAFVSGIAPAGSRGAREVATLADFVLSHLSLTSSRVLEVA